MLFAPLRPTHFVQKSFRELGAEGLAILALFWCMVPFARAYFYLRDIARGVHPMTGFKTPRMALAFPFLFKR